MAQDRVAPSEFPVPVPAPYIPQGYRAITIGGNVAIESARPGDRVAVAYRPSTEPATGRVIEIVSSAHVLSFESSANRETAESTGGQGQITLLVTSEDAARISLASERGAIVLRKASSSKLQVPGE
jgi:Flp pilus assembly protein CpaB